MLDSEKQACIRYVNSLHLFMKDSPASAVLPLSFIIQDLESRGGGYELFVHKDGDLMDRVHA